MWCAFYPLKTQKALEIQGLLCQGAKLLHRFGIIVQKSNITNHDKGVYEIRNSLRYGIGTKCRMKSSRSDVWHQSEGEIHAGA